jgi:hypothetical protein
MRAKRLSLAAFCAQVAGRDEEFEAHEEAIGCQLSAVRQVGL